MKRVAPLLLALALAGCGGSTTADSSKAKAAPCNGTTCAPGEACVMTTTAGGPCIMPDDAGVCPDGTHTTGCCQNIGTSYQCKPLPGACGGVLSCPCAASLCQCGGCLIGDAGVLSCQCLYP